MQLDRFAHNFPAWLYYLHKVAGYEWNACAIRAGSTSKIRASQGPKWFFPKMPPFSSWHSPRHKSLTVVHDLLNFGGCRAIFCYLMLFSTTFSRFVKGTLGSILRAQTPSNWPHHGSSFCQAWPKEYFGLWGGRDRSRQARATVQCKMHDFQHAFDTVALVCRLQSLPLQRPKYFLGHAWQTHMAPPKICTVLPFLTYENSAEM